MQCSVAPAVLLSFGLLGCSTPHLQLDAAWLGVAVTGELAVADAGGGSAAEQDLGNAFGLGSRRDVPLLSAELGVGDVTLAASGFWLDDQGQGTLTGTFGGLGQGTQVRSDLQLAVVQAVATHDWRLGPVTLSPGLAVDVFDVEFTAEEALLGNQERVDETLLVPMLALGIATTTGPCRWSGRLGYFDMPEVDSFRARVLDAEAAVRWTPWQRWELLAGYRHVGITARGTSAADSYDVELGVAGWFLGGGIRF